MLQTIFLVVMIVISIALTGVVLLQRSEGGALGMGGGPSGFMTARGAGNLLTKTTWYLGAAFAVCAIALTVLGNTERAGSSVADAAAIGALATGEPAAPSAEAPAGAPTAPTSQEPSLSDLEASLSAAPARPAEQPAQ